MTTSSNPRPIYTIGAVSRMLDVPVGTLRSWEARYGIVRPARTPGRQRLYSRDQLEQLQFLKNQIADGATPAEAHRLFEDQFGVADDGDVRAMPGGRRLLILLAERDRYAAELSEYFLRTEGYEVLLTLDAADAERRFGQTQPDLAVVELLISGGAGIDLCRRLRARSSTPILAISGLDIPEEAVDAGADAFLKKPLDPLVLVSTVKDLLGESALIRGR
ncbi:MAG: MerR family transcriptional regulator [Candidatus Limnocylindrales bacterium]|jgi:CheY-like chemotaxis protein